MKYLAVLLIILFSLSACGAGDGGRRGAPSGKQLGQSGGVKTRPDPLLERSIVLLHPASGEKFEGTYYRNKAYDQRAMASINHLMRDRHVDEAGGIDPELIDFLVDIRTRLGLPPTIVFEILSGYRSRTTNEKLAETNTAVAKESLHMYGWAVDFRVSAVNGSAIAEIAKTMQRGGVSFYANDNHVHVDIGNIRTWGSGPNKGKKAYTGP